MRLRALLDTDALGLRLLGGEDELDRTVRGVMTTDLRDPSRYLSGGELVLTGLAWRRDAADSEPFVRILVQAQVAALAAGEAELGDIPDDLVVACARHRLPLFAVHESVAFATITEHVVRQVSGERAGDLAAVVDRHRRMMTPGPAGGGPDVVLDLLHSDLDLRAWVLSPTGLPIAGPAPGPAADVCARLAAEHLSATRGGRCTILTLRLDTLDLTLLGLNVHLDKVVLRVTGRRSGGVLGSLFCSLARARVRASRAAAAARINTAIHRHGALRPIGFEVPVTAVTSQAAPRCNVLELILGPLHVDLLGLFVDLNRVHLTITAVPGAGALLGNLLCAVANLLNGGGGGLAGLLNRILGAL
jgi:hypothetical protein